MRTLRLMGSGDDRAVPKTIFPITEATTCDVRSPSSLTIGAYSSVVTTSRQLAGLRREIT